MRPLETLALGLSITTTAIVLGLGLATYRPASPDEQAWMPVVAMALVNFIAVILTAVVYQERYSAYRARRAAEETVKQLREAQARLLISENAASQGRFAAALSHELNSPLGALTSAVDTLLAVLRQLSEHPEYYPRVREVVLGCSGAARRSSERLKQIVGRMKAITNLDRAEAQVVDLNALCQETVAFLASELEPRARVKLTLNPLPPVRCRPQQLTAVVSHLLRNAVAAIEDQGNIEVVSDRRDGEIVVEVRDDGRGIPADRLPHLFDPTIRVEGGRVQTTNWGLFVSRTIVNEHGGQIEIVSAPGRGTTARIVLPLRPPG